MGNRQGGRSIIGQRVSFHGHRLRTKPTRPVHARSAPSSQGRAASSSKEGLPWRKNNVTCLGMVTCSGERSPIFSELPQGRGHFSFYELLCRIYIGKTPKDKIVQQDLESEYFPLVR